MCSTWHLLGSLCRVLKIPLTSQSAVSCFCHQEQEVHVHKWEGDRLGVELSAGAFAYLQMHRLCPQLSEPPTLSAGIWFLLNASCFSTTRKPNTGALLGGPP